MQQIAYLQNGKLQQTGAHPGNVTAPNREDELYWREWLTICNVHLGKVTIKVGTDIIKLKKT